MNIADTPRRAATAATRTPILPAGPDETVAGFGVMGLPFAGGHYLALRDFPAASFLPATAPGYRSVWHRDPEGRWTFFATTPAEHSCARYFSAATDIPAVQCPIEVTWTGERTLVVDIPDVLHWSVELVETPATRLLSAMGSRLPDAVWSRVAALDVIGACAQSMLGAGRVRLAGSTPNGQRFRIAPKRLWAVRDSTAVLRGQDLGRVAALPTQARLADFCCPQRGLAVIGQGRFSGPTRT